LPAGGTAEATARSTTASVAGMAPGGAVLVRLWALARSAACTKKRRHPERHGLPLSGRALVAIVRGDDGHCGWPCTRVQAPLDQGDERHGLVAPRRTV
jgi:hypothetical protein